MNFPPEGAMQIWVWLSLTHCCNTAIQISTEYKDFTTTTTTRIYPLVCTLQQQWLYSFIQALVIMDAVYIGLDNQILWDVQESVQGWGLAQIGMWIIPQPHTQQDPLKISKIKSLHMGRVAGANPSHHHHLGPVHHTYNHIHMETNTIHTNVYTYGQSRPSNSRAGIERSTV